MGLISMGAEDALGTNYFQIVSSSTYTFLTVSIVGIIRNIPEPYEVPKVTQNMSKHTWFQIPNEAPEYLTT